MRTKREIPTSQAQKDYWREVKAKSRRKQKSCPKDTLTQQFDFTNGQRAALPADARDGGHSGEGFPLKEYREVAKAYQHKRGGRMLLEALNEIQRLRDIATLLHKEFILE
jgi:hypothetical protein